MVKVVLQIQVGAADRVDQFDRLPGGLQVELRHVVAVDRFDQQTDILPRQSVGGVAQVLLHPFVGGVAADGGIRIADQAVDAIAAQRLRILDRAPDAVAELRFAPRQAGDAPFARRPVAGRQVEQHRLRRCASSSLRSAAIG